MVIGGLVKCADPWIGLGGLEAAGSEGLAGRIEQGRGDPCVPMFLRDNEANNRANLVDVIDRQFMGEGESGNLEARRGFAPSYGQTRTKGEEARHVTCQDEIRDCLPVLGCRARVPFVGDGIVMEVAVARCPVRVVREGWAIEEREIVLEEIR